MKIISTREKNKQVIFKLIINKVKIEDLNLR